MKIDFPKKLNFKLGKLPTLGISPESDWKFIFIATLIALIVVVSWSVYIFIEIDKGEIFMSDKSKDSGITPLDISLLKNTVKYYEKKELEFERIKREGIESRDPSI